MKLWWGLVERFNKLCQDDEDLDIYFKERPWILEPYKMVTYPNHMKPMKELVPRVRITLAPEIYARHKQIILEMGKVSDKIHKLVVPIEPVENKEEDPEMNELFGPITT